MMNIGDNQMKAALLRAVPFAGLALALTVGVQASRAGQLVFDMQDLDHPSIAVNTVHGAGDPCANYAPNYVQCGFLYFSPAAGTATVDVLDNVTGGTSSFGVGAGSTNLILDYYASQAQTSLKGGFFNVTWEGPSRNPRNVIGALFQDFLPAFSATVPCYGGCKPALHGGDELVATFTYRDSGGSVLGADTIHIISAGSSAAPEPATALLLIPGLAVAGIRARRRRVRK
jgi:hypothetical protein